jgi:glycosyltransferase involved in cell wall biosynthesis
MDALRVLILGLNYAPEPAGVAPYTTGLAEGLAARGHRVRVLTGLPHYPQWAITPGYENGRVVAAGDGPAVTHLVHHVPPPGSLSGRLRMELSFGRRSTTASWGAPEVIVCVSPALFATGMAIARAKASPHRPGIGVWVQDLYGLGVVETQAVGARSGAAMRAVESAVLRSADGLAVIHDRFKSSVVANLGIAPEKVSVIRNWTHVSPSNPDHRADTRLRHGWGSDEIVALHAGNMGAKQGLENVIAAAQMAERSSARVRFVLLGDGNQRSKLESLSRDVATVQLISPLPDEEYRAALLAADVLLVNETPTVGDMAVPSKITSYFTSGNPIVAATRADSITASEILGSGAGLVVPPDDPGELLAAVRQLGADRDLARRLGQAGAEFCSRSLSMTTAIDEFESWIGQLARTTQEGAGDVETRAHHGNHRPGRLLSGRTAATKRIRGPRSHPAGVQLQHRPDRPSVL